MSPILYRIAFVLVIASCRRQSPAPSATGADDGSASAREPGVSEQRSLANALRLEAKLRPDAQSAGNVEIVVVASNVGSEAIPLQGDGCRILVRAYRSSAQTSAIWVQERALPDGAIFGCPLNLWHATISPGASVEIGRARIRLRAVLGDSLPEGRYHLGVRVRLNADSATIPAGLVELRR